MSYKINLNADLAHELREVINSEINISINKTDTKKAKSYPAWNRICAIMDRLDDTVEYLNNLELNTGKYKASAFDFFEFMNQSSVLIDCIKFIAKIYNVSLDNINKSTRIFNQKGEDGEGTDEKYFQYLRSLCSVHPIETSHYYKTYHNDIFECSPYVIWNNGRYGGNIDPASLCAVVYLTKDTDNTKRININILEIFEYVKLRYEFLIIVIKEIKKYHEAVILSHKNTPIKTQNEFSSFNEYLENLKVEAETRFGREWSYSLISQAISVFRTEITNTKNQSKYQKYCAAINYAIKFEHNALQNMDYEDYLNNGLEFPKKNMQSSLLNEIISPCSHSEEYQKFHYHLEKITCLSYMSDFNQKAWAYQMLEEAKPYLEKYVTFDSAIGDREHYTLVNIALYFDCLNNNCFLNKNLPNSLIYRNKLLTESEVLKLCIAEPEPKEITAEELEELIKQFSELSY